MSSSELHHTTVSDRQWVTPRLVRLTLAGDSLRAMRTRPAQDIEVLLEDRGRPVKRRYTIRALRPDHAELDIDVLIHAGRGPGSAWAERAALGDEVRFLGPKGKLVLRPADWHLFAGDEAALPAITALTETLGPQATTLVLAEVDGAADEIPISACRLRWLHRHGAAAGTTSLLAGALDDLEVPAGVGRAYLLGETHTVHGLRSRLARIGIPDERAFIKGYWNRPSATVRRLRPRVGSAGRR